MKVAILGFSREGASSLGFLKKQKTVFGRPQKEVAYWILDYKTNLKLPRGVKKQLGREYLSHLEDFDVIIRSPGVPYMRKELVAARKHGVEFTSATRLFFEHCPAKIIGVTGTKGKGTTAMMLYQILKAAKKEVFFVGNIGKPALDLMPKIKKGSLVIFELSSFQLQDLEQSPEIAIVLGVTPDHLDSHRNFKEYVTAKSHIASFQKKNDWIFYDTKNTWASWIAKKSRGHKVPITPQKSIVSLADLYLPAPHLLSNAALASAAAKQLGCSKTIITKALRKFRGYEHRLEFVRKINGVAYYNDSAATSPVATIAAIQSFQEPIILIAGGKDKNLEYKPMVEAIDHPPVKLIVLIGENKQKIIHHLKHTPFITSRSLEAALSQASQKATPGDIVLFSSGATSFDMFKNYSERGRIFKQLIAKLKK